MVKKTLMLTMLIGAFNCYAKPHKCYLTLCFQKNIDGFQVTEEFQHNEIPDCESKYDCKKHAKVFAKSIQFDDGTKVIVKGSWHKKKFTVK